MLYFKDSKDGYYQFDDNAPEEWYSHLTPTTQPVPSAEEIAQQAEYDSKQYQRDRLEAYPSLNDQADMQYHDLVDGTTTWKDAIAAVKDAHPKP